MHFQRSGDDFWITILRTIWEHLPVPRRKEAYSLKKLGESAPSSSVRAWEFETGVDTLLSSQRGVSRYRGKIYAHQKCELELVHSRRKVHTTREPNEDFRDTASDSCSITHVSIITDCPAIDYHTADSFKNLCPSLLISSDVTLVSIVLLSHRQASKYTPCYHYPTKPIEPRLSI